MDRQITDGTKLRLLVLSVLFHIARDMSDNLFDYAQECLLMPPLPSCWCADNYYQSGSAENGS